MPGVGGARAKRSTAKRWPQFGKLMTSVGDGATYPPFFRSWCLSRRPVWECRTQFLEIARRYEP